MEYRDGRLTRVADSPGNYVIHCLFRLRYQSDRINSDDEMSEAFVSENLQRPIDSSILPHGLRICWKYLIVPLCIYLSLLSPFLVMELPSLSFGCPTGFPILGDRV
jgi:hypothetical protein